MSQPTQSYVRNCLLSALPEDAYSLLRPHLESVVFERGETLIARDVPITHVHFPEHGIGSIIASTPSGGSVETGLFGREGMSGVPVVLGVACASQTSIIQVPGDGYRLEADVLRQAMAQSSRQFAPLLVYVQTLMTQTSYTALSNVDQPVEQRLARWILMCHDRIDGDELALTHEFLAIMLAVRRPSVTTALHALEGHHFIKSRRGLITITDREAMIDYADGSYGVVEAEYERLIAAFR